MAPPHGTRDDGSPQGGFGNFVSACMDFLMFCMLAGAALAVFASAVLLPEYARLRQAQYQLARQQASDAKMNALIEGDKRCIAALPHDAVLNKRLAMNELGYWPDDEAVMLTGQSPLRGSPVSVAAPRIPEPRPPAGWMMAVAQRVSNPPTQRGLLLMAVIGLIAAVLLFPGGKDPKKRRTIIHPPDENANGW